jgi:hypothetical protein
MCSHTNIVFLCVCVIAVPVPAAVAAPVTVTNAVEAAVAVLVLVLVPVPVPGTGPGPAPVQVQVAVAIATVEVAVMAKSDHLRAEVAEVVPLLRAMKLSMVIAKVLLPRAALRKRTHPGLPEKKIPKKSTAQVGQETVTRTRNHIVDTGTNVGEGVRTKEDRERAKQTTNTTDRSTGR